jgi:hypothetical protein
MVCSRATLFVCAFIALGLAACGSSSDSSSESSVSAPQRHFENSGRATSATGDYKVTLEITAETNAGKGSFLLEYQNAIDYSHAATVHFSSRRIYDGDPPVEATIVWDGSKLDPKDWPQVGLFFGYADGSPRHVSLDVMVQRFREDRRDVDVRLHGGPPELAVRAIPRGDPGSERGATVDVRFIYTRK